MKNSEDIKTARKKLLIKIIMGVAIILVIIWAAIGVLEVINKRLRESNQQKFEESIAKGSLIFHNADYSLNIFDLKEYTSLNRGIMYRNDNTGTYITDDSPEAYEVYSYELAFMAKLIQYIINGNADGYNASFTEEYKSKYSEVIRERFTMQQLYNIEVEFLKEEEDTGDPMFDYVYTDYKVSYMIRENTGTFRNDLPEECWVPVVYKIVSEYEKSMIKPSEIQVYEVIDYSKYNSGLFD